MGLYNTIFGRNPLSTAILATLNLTPAQVGRFRDAFVSEGKIAIYTRNGGNNRQCVHTDPPHHGNEMCKHHIEKAEVTHYGETGFGNLILVDPQKVRTQIEDVYICEHPDSEDCGCYGCAITHRLPKHPCYISDQDDDFDQTYATIYFRFPEEFADDLRKIQLEEPFNPSERWKKAIEALQSK